MRTPLPTLALSLLLASPVGLAAQEGGSEGERPGWIGVGIQESLHCDARQVGGETDETPESVPLIQARDCRAVLVTEAVFDDAPAARAGMQPGDTLVAVNGRPLSERRGAEELGSLRPGQPVELLVGRKGGRVSLRITPEPRPRERGPAPVLTPGSPSVFVDPDDLTGLERAAAELGRAPRVRLRFEGGEISGALKVDDQGHVYLEKGPQELVRIRGAELPPPKVRALRDSALAEARERLEKVREKIRARSPGAPPVPWQEDSERIRMLGAEFLTLTSELAGNLQGVDAGLLVLRVVPGTPAARMGLRPGDVVVEAGGQAVEGGTDLRSPFTEVARGDSVVVRWVRRGQEMRGALQRP